MAKRTSRIPEDLQQLLISAVAQAASRFHKGTDSLLNTELEVLRLDFPPKYQSLPLDYMQRSMMNLRKAGKTGPVNGGQGPRKGSRKKRSKPPDIYLEYLKSKEWADQKQKHQWLEFWDFRCSYCNREHNLDHHHRTYERLGYEKFTDVVILCRKCHEAIEAEKEEQRLMSLFPTEE